MAIRLTPASRAPDPYLVDFSEFGQPAAVRRYLPPDIPHLLVDIGAHDGIQGSNSRQFLLDGWQGVLAEPMPKVFQRLRENSRAFPDVRLFNCAVGNRNGQAEIRYPQGQETGQDASLYFQRTGDAPIPVVIATLTAILSQVEMPRVFGVLMIDTEGGDLEVLQGLDFTRYQPAVILTEDYGPKHAEKLRLLADAGYDFRERAGADSIWTSRQVVGGQIWPAQSPALVHPADIDTFLSGQQAGSGHVWLEEIAADFTLMRGWAHLGPDRPVPAQIGVVLTLTDGSRRCFLGFRCPRSDVASHFGCPGLLMSGFRIHLPAGSHRMTVASVGLVQTDGSDIHLSSVVMAHGA